MISLEDKHIAILVDNFFEQAEFEEPINILRDAGAVVTVISLKQRHLQALKHAEKGDTFEADTLIRHASADEFDALVLPGGAINADSLRVNDEAQAWVEEFIDSGKPLAAICHAPWLLASADVIEGRRLTSYYTIRDDLINAGAEWVDLPVVVDDNLITSRKPEDIPRFVDAIIVKLQQSSPKKMRRKTDIVSNHT